MKKITLLLAALFLQSREPVWAGVVDGQPIDAAVTNAAYINKNTNDTTPSTLGLANTLTASGGTVVNLQAQVNAIDSFSGVIANSAYNVKPVWTNNNVGTSTDSLKSRVEALSAIFGSGPVVPISAGGTGQTTAAAAFNALSPMTTLGDIEYEQAANSAFRLPGNTSTTKMYLSQTGTGLVSAAPNWAQINFVDIAGLATIAQGGTNSTTALFNNRIMTSVSGSIVENAALTASSPMRTNGSGLPTTGQTSLTTEVTGILPIANGGTNSGTASGAFNNLSPVTLLGDLIYGSGASTNARLAGNTTSTMQFLVQTGTGSVSAAPVWHTFVAGDLPTITLSGDATGSGSGGSIPLTLATVNSNVGSFTNANITVNGKGLITAASSGTGGSGGAGSGIELLPDPGFETGAFTVGGYTNTGGTKAIVSSGSNLLFGLYSASFLATASSQTFKSGAIAIQGLAGATCQATIYYLYSGTSGDYTVQVQDGSANTLASQSLNANSVAGSPVNITFPCGSTSTSTLQWQLVSNVASPSTIYFDNLHLGSIQTQQVSQSTYMGGLILPSGCTYSNVSTSSLADMTISGCSGSSLTGQASSYASGSNGGVTFNSLPPGNYRAVWSGTCSKLVTDSSSAVFALTDGVTTSTAMGVAVPTNSYLRTPCTMELRTAYATAGPVTFKIQSYEPTGAGDASYANLYGAGESFSLYRYPTAAQTVLGPDQTAASWSGYQTVASGWSTTSSTFADVAAGASIVLTQLTNRNFGTVANAASSLPGIIPPFPKTGMFKVCASVNFGTSTTQTATMRLVDGSSNIINAGVSATFVSNDDGNYNICGDYNVTSLSPPPTIKVQVATNAGTVTISNGVASGSPAISWSVMQEDAGQPAPLLTGNVTSNGSGSYRVESARVNCATGSSSILSQSGSWLTGSTTYNGAGDCTFTIGASAFSAAPVCTCTSTDGALRVCSNATTTSTSIRTTSFTNGTAADQTSAIMCMGPH